MKQKNGQQQNEGNNMWKGTHLMKVDVKERKKFKKHPDKHELPYLKPSDRLSSSSLWLVRFQILKEKKHKISLISEW